MQKWIDWYCLVPDRQDGGMILSFFLYLVLAAWQDGRRRAVSGWLFLFFFSHFLVSQICQKVVDVNMEGLPASLWYRGMAVDGRGAVLGLGVLFGALLLLISKCSRGALGEGDGIFFIVAGIYLGLWKNLILFFSALGLCSVFGLFLLFWGWLHGKDYRKKKLPFLLFTLPAGVYLIWML